MSGVFMEPDDRRWSDFLRTVPHDIYHLPGYVTLASRCEGGKPVAFHARKNERAVLIPLLLRRLPDAFVERDELWDASSPYGYPSPLFSHPEDKASCRELMEIFFKSCEDFGLITLFVRLHPLLASPLEVLSDMGNLVLHGKTVTIDLQNPLHELLRDTSDNHRRGLKKLNRAGFHAVLDEWHLYRDFIRIYRDTMIRVGADPFYLFEDDYFEDLQSLLEPHLHLCSILSAEGELAAAGLFTVVDDIIEYHLGCTEARYLKQAPSKMMFDFMRRWGHDQGLRIFHLGGGLGGKDDSLFKFKAGFSSHFETFHTFRLVLNRAVYSSLVASWAKQTGRDPENNDFFPLYRSPLTD
jgi:hypothetical protein